MAFKKQRMGRKKVCYFTKNKIEYIDYKDVELLKRFIKRIKRAWRRQNISPGFFILCSLTWIESNITAA